MRPSGELIVAAVVAIDDDHTLATFLGGLGMYVSMKTIGGYSITKGTFMHVTNGKLGNSSSPARV